MQRRVALIFGTRPEAIKLAPLVRGFAAHPNLAPLVISIFNCARDRFGHTARHSSAGTSANDRGGSSSQMPTHATTNPTPTTASVRLSRGVMRVASRLSMSATIACSWTFGFSAIPGEVSGGYPV